MLVTAGSVGCGDGRIIARAALLLDIGWFQMVEKGTKGKEGRCVGVESLIAFEADPRPVHDRVPHMDRHHIGSSPHIRGRSR